MNVPEVGDGQVRIGITIAVPEPLRAELMAARIRFGDIAAEHVPPHITLLMPTVVNRDELVAIDEHLDQIAARHTAFSIRLRGTATFRPVSPVVFVQVVQGISDCERLAEAVRTGPLVQELRFPYHPHVTVAQEVPDAALDRAFDEMANVDATFTVSQIHRYVHGADRVWRSERTYQLGAA